MKRVLAIILSIILLMGTIVNPVYAAQLTEDAAEEAVPEESAEEPVVNPEEEQAENLTAEPAEVPEEASEEEAVHTTETQVFRTEGEDRGDALLYGYLNKKLADKNC